MKGVRDLRPLDEGEIGYYGLLHLMLTLKQKGILTMEEIENIADWGSQGFNGFNERARKDSWKDTQKAITEVDVKESTKHWLKKEGSPL